MITRHLRDARDELPAAAAARGGPSRWGALRLSPLFCLIITASFGCLTLLRRWLSVLLITCSAFHS